MIDADQLANLAHDAGEAILSVYQDGSPLHIEQKSDESPLTEADRRSHQVIAAGLAALTPNLRVVSEEDSGTSAGPDGADREYWLVDPLDGTKEFIKKTGEFTVNIALIRDGCPVFGVVHAPVLGVTWLTAGVGAERWHNGGRRKIRVAVPADRAELRVVASRDHAGATVRAMLDRLPGATTLSMGSSLKFCLVAEGLADLYYRDGPTMPWDTAAAHAVLSAAGGEVYSTNGAPLRYHEPRILNPQFVAVGDTSFDWKSLITPEDMR